MSKEQQYQRVKFRILGMDCASCASVTEKALKGAKGIKSIGISYMTDTAYVEFDPNEVNGDSIKRAIKKAGYNSIIER